ncbi:MAG: hypothetical protein ABIZ70_03965, partial [Gemmatimonadales bacterium]
MPTKPTTATAIFATLLLIACGREVTPTAVKQAQRSGRPVAVIDTTISDAFNASGSAEPMRMAILSSRLMASVNSVD